MPAAQTALPAISHRSAKSHRSAAGRMRLTDRDIQGLTLCAEQYAAPVDLLAAALDVPPERLRGILARWRQAGYAETGLLGQGPAWCWLTPAGMRLLGRPYRARQPSVSRLAHIRAVLAVRLWLEAGELYQQEHAWWRSERRIRAAAAGGGRVAVAHVPDAELHWPSLETSPYGGQIWAIEAELSPKPLARTVGIMRTMLTRTGDYGPTEDGGREPRYAQVVYLTAPAAASIVGRSIGALPIPLQHRMSVRDLPRGALR